MKSKHLILLCILINWNSLHGQTYTGLDTILLKESYSNIPIMSTTENLILSLGFPEPMAVNYNRKFSINKMEKGAVEKDTSYYLNSIHYFKKGISYWEKNGKIRLLAINFKKSPEVFISTSKIILSRKLTLDGLLDIFHYTKDDIARPQLGALAPYPAKKSDCFYQINFQTGEHDNIYIKLYFDCSKKLRYMSIDVYDSW